MAKNRIVCKSCHNQGYTIVAENTFSRAEICECVVGCLICTGTGLVSTENERGYSYLHPCSVCGNIHGNVKKYNNAGIPAKYSNVQYVDSFKHDGNEEKQRALKYAKDKFLRNYPHERGFLLMGPSGVGKTHLAVAAISELTLRKGIKCLFKDFFLLLSELRQAYTEGRSENEVLHPLVETEVLVIDELGKGKSNEWELGILDQLISKRYNSNKKTLITSNYVSRDYIRKNSLTTEILENRVGERIASRLFEMCRFLLIEGSDYRKQIR